MFDQTMWKLLLLVVFPFASKAIVPSPPGPPGPPGPAGGGSSRSIWAHQPYATGGDGSAWSVDYFNIYGSFDFLVPFAVGFGNVQSSLVALDNGIDRIDLEDSIRSLAWNVPYDLVLRRLALTVRVNEIRVFPSLDTNGTLNAALYVNNDTAQPNVLFRTHLLQSWNVTTADSVPTYHTTVLNGRVSLATSMHVLLLVWLVPADIYPVIESMEVLLGVDGSVAFCSSAGSDC
jgi:hypothetical protein